MLSLENQMGQMATAISRLEAQVGGKLPSQTVVNPKENVNAATLRSGKKVEEPKLNIPSVAKEAKIEDEFGREEGTTESKVIPNPSIQLPSNTLPFPSRFTKSKKEEKDKEILEMFRKVEVNIPLLDAIKQVPRYAKFLKELCTNKRKLNGDEKIIMGENVSVVFQRKLPPKCKDPGMFTIPCKIGNTKIERAMLDLGALINVMPRSIYASLNLGPVKDTGVIIQLADRTNAYPEGVVEDVLVQVNELVFPADFYILDMDDSSSPDPAPILLGRPFLNIARTKIDVHDGTLTIEFDGESIFAIDVVDPIDSIVQEIFELNNADELEVALLKHVESEEKGKIELSEELKETVAALRSLKPSPERYGVSFIKLSDSHQKLLPSVLQAPTLELKPLLGHLKYVYLGENETLPGYNQIVIALEDEEKTTFTCPFGTFTYHRLLFGLCNAPATFQRCMMHGN
ncbi:uncharacterized protein LOC116133925 [Pistacia vera]|uniref:uncharacterized protein LOC116133925 n=1 Tax=Pistacia vera TaxID=55513 RepID=UPI0012631BBD|nr:uncharacterized protein LOC116133925 [Pistacia vera]